MTTNIHPAWDLRQDDIVIAFMGPPKAGKSFFISLLTDHPVRQARHWLWNITSAIEAIRVSRPKYGDRIVLVDVPSFDDIRRTDLEVLKMIGKWLKKTYERDIKLSGIIYLHRITDRRVGASPLKNLRMFGALCGDVTMTSVSMVTNMWQKVKPEVGAAREAELTATFWKPFIVNGASVERLVTNDSTAAWRIVEQCIQRGGGESLLLQEELVEFERNLGETAAGKTLHTMLLRALDNQKELLESLRVKIEESNDATLTKELRKECGEIEQEIIRTSEEAKKLDVSRQTLKRTILSAIGKSTGVVCSFFGGVKLALTSHPRSPSTVRDMSRTITDTMAKI
ncbi:hypothetical protein P691DRAFT_722640 [Macrolepiota fuliginosa MF-IS2]|uniref:G domain-containing protein n=1 Tax=Macrolepiota fuliginosa MF-IS2 TaxID=1400762 RepID=A0A9P6C7P4_9AGAR|nr:hypothetical protein P691DRAFT_722640 [Macrolepiota fuliginosa MF-IS2]